MEIDNNHVFTEIEINASPEEVWSVLTDWDKLKEWSTTIFKQEDGLHGPHSRLLNFLAAHQMLSMYKKFNQELKERVESLYPENK